MTERPEIDPRELAALREEFEQAQSSRNRERAGILVERDITESGDKEAVFRYLSDFDPELMEKFKDPDFNYLSLWILHYSLQESQEHSKTLDNLEVDLNLNYLSEIEPKFGKIPLHDLLEKKEMISLVRTKALVDRKFTKANVIKRLAGIMASSLLPELLRNKIAIPDSMRSLVSQSELDDYQEALTLDEVQIDEQEAEAEVRSFREKHRVVNQEYTFEQFMDTMQDTERMKEVLQKLDKIIPDPEKLSALILNAHEGELPV